MKDPVKNIGRVVEGSVLDMRKSTLEKALKDYDSQLYIKWNPEKNRGCGLWEIRRTPNQKSAVYFSDFEGHKIFDIRYVENDIINHVLDVHVLNYKVLEKIKAMDTWQYSDYVSALEAKEKESKDKYNRKQRDDMRYAVRHHRKAFRDLQEYTQRGFNPFEFFFGSYD